VLRKEYVDCSAFSLSSSDLEYSDEENHNPDGESIEDDDENYANQFMSESDDNSDDDELSIWTGDFAHNGSVEGSAGEKAETDRPERMPNRDIVSCQSPTYPYLPHNPGHHDKTISENNINDLLEGQEIAVRKHNRNGFGIRHKRVSRRAIIRDSIRRFIEEPPQDQPWSILKLRHSTGRDERSRP
jgi:hypothetical protein